MLNNLLIRVGCVVAFWVILVGNLAFAQQHPLSKHDSALVVKYIAEYETYLHHHGNIKDATHYLNETAFIYWEHNQYKEAIKYYKLSAELNEEIENENGIAMINNNLGMLHADIMDYNTSYEYFMLTLGARRSKNERIGMISALINLSVVLNNLKRYDESVEFLQEALQLAREMNDVDQMKSCYGMLSETFEKSGNAKQSIYYFNLYKTFTKMAQSEQLNKIMEDYSEEKLLKTQLEEENKKHLEALDLKQSELQSIKHQSAQFDEKINKYDSINMALYRDLSQKELQLQVLTKAAQIEQLEANQKIQEERIAREQHSKKSQIAIITSIGMVIIIFFIVRSSWRTKRWANDLKEKNSQIEEQGVELKHLNENLQLLVDQRTQTLSDFIFSNSHIIRRPVANIKGIVDLMNKNGVEEKNKQLLELLDKSNNELDEALNDFNKSLTYSESIVNETNKTTEISNG